MLKKNQGTVIMAGNRVFWVCCLGLCAVLSSKVIACDHESNLVKNCGFDSNLDYWEVIPGNANYGVEDTVDASNATAAFISPYTNSVSLHQCLPGGPAGQYFMYVRNKAEGTKLDEDFCSLAALLFPGSDDCSTSTYGTLYTELEITEVFLENLKTVNAEIDFLSAELIIHCNSSQNGVEKNRFFFDDVHFGQEAPVTSNLFFKDGFEQ